MLLPIVILLLPGIKKIENAGFIQRNPDRMQKSRIKEFQLLADLQIPFVHDFLRAWLEDMVESGNSITSKHLFRSEHRKLKLTIALLHAQSSSDV